VRDEAMLQLPQTRVATLDHQPRDVEVDFAVTAARQATTIVIMTRDATEFPYQVEIASQVLAASDPGARIIHVALRGPYDKGILGQVSETILTFGDPAVSLKALVGILAGAIAPTATVPVALA
jgi:hypothetical protein